jgi:hypothetical protein
MRWSPTSVNTNRSRSQDCVILLNFRTSLDRVESINDLGVIMDNKMTSAGHIDVMVGKALAILGFVKPYTLKTLYVSLVRPKLEYASCVWRPSHGAHINRIERVQKKFVGYALRGLEWTDMFDLPPYVDRCALIRPETLPARRANILSGRVNLSNLLSLISVNAAWYHTWAGDFL